MPEEKKDILLTQF